jgi:hypothetical protein
MILSHIIPPEDMRTILISSQRLVLAIATNLDRSSRTVRDLIRLYYPLKMLERQRVENSESLSRTAKDYERITLGEIAEMQRAITKSQTLVTDMLVTFDCHLISEGIPLRIAPASRYTKLASILSTVHRVEHALQSGPREEVFAKHHEWLGDSLLTLTTALIKGVPARDGRSVQANYKLILDTIHKLIGIYQPSQAVYNLLTSTFATVYGEGGLADSIRLIEHFWSRLELEDKTVVANHYVQALWHSFNRQIHGRKNDSLLMGAPIPAVLDQQLASISCSDRVTGYFVPSFWRHTPGPIIISHKVAEEHSPLEMLNTIGHEMVHAFMYHLIRENLTPPGCERDLKWLQASSMLSRIKGTYRHNPHEQTARLVEDPFIRFFSRQNNS